MVKKKLNAWQKRQEKDHFVKQARKHGYRSRAAFKLKEVQEKYHFILPYHKVLELGAAPGSWSMLIDQWLSPSGSLSAVDRLPMAKIGPHTEVFEFDVETESFDQWLATRFLDQSLDWVISDMAPNMSGHRSTDQIRSIALCEQTLAIGQAHLKDGGGLFMKSFQGEGFVTLINTIRKVFTKVHLIKPEASNRSAREVYILALGLCRL